ncbi:hypothetical protein [Adhaeribacter aquaticus]|uniref:hypothetical protein n=1 Tax=Adhaeribacter aquaticus TaxID=299567 RepID=UPI000402724B|nr:hypothetical protein [Adhaeribacter aquaticus]
MPKVFRLHDKGKQQIEGWQQSSQLTHIEINDITDPTGAKASKVVTSIPTPFARMHLFETAFDFINADKNRNQQSLYHELVSHYWDLFELLFNFHNYREAGKKISIRRWNIESELQALRSNPGTKLLGDTLRLFLNDHRFQGFSDLYLIYYEYTRPNGETAERLIGGTSPFTLLFTSPKLEPLDIERPQARGHYFDKNIVLLHDRDKAFQDFVYNLFLVKPSLRQKNFCGSIFANLDLDRFNAMELRGDVTSASFEAAFTTLADVQGNPVTIKDITLPTRSNNVEINSDLFVRLSPGAAQVLVLPIVLKPNLKIEANYLNGQRWDAATPVPWVDPTPLESRVLPGKKYKYPYLTVGDLLEENLIELPYEVNTDRFHTGQITYNYGADTRLKHKFPYLLPIKRTFFDYFEERDLFENLTFAIDINHVKVSLRIPVQRGDAIVYERSYYTNPQNSKDQFGNEIPEKGTIIKAKVGLGFFPFYKLRSQAQHNDLYKVMLVDDDTAPSLVNKRYDLKFYIGNQEITPGGGNRNATKVERTSKTISSAGSAYYEVQHTHFDYLELICPQGEGVKGLIVPRWTELDRGTQNFTFSVDFGTTNTHVAYNNAPSAHPKTFNIGENDMQVVLLNAPSADVNKTVYERYRAGFGELFPVLLIQNREFVPSFIGEQGSIFEFPIRTATCETPNFPNEPTHVLGNINIGFAINSEVSMVQQARYETNLKWSMELDTHSEDRIEAFFRELLLMIKHKVALNNGIIENTRLIWFRPLSFDMFSLNQFKSKWDEAYQQIFKTSQTTICLTESVAPYYYLTATNQVVPNRDENVVNIDIGGGTTDLLFLKGQQPAYSTSFRFAGDDLWSEGYSRLQGAGKQNGFLQAYSKENRTLASTEKEQEARQAFDLAMTNDQFRSADVVSLLFSYDNELRFSGHLMKARQLRIIFYLHYTAIIYHIAQLIKHLQIETPRYFCFSGKGSLYIKLLSGGPNMMIVERLTKLILKKVTGVEPKSNFKIILANNPKEATANGGVLFDGSSEQGSYEYIQEVKLLGGTEPQDIRTNFISAEQIDAATRDSVVENAQAFLNLVLQDGEVASLLPDLGVQADMNFLRDYLKQQVSDSLSIGLNQLHKHLRTDEVLPETLFFYPLKQTLYQLSRELYERHYASKSTI